MDNPRNDSLDSSSDLTPWHWGWAAAIAVVTLITLAFRYALPVRDGDLWFHMLYGKYFLEHKTLIADHTIFSWTPTTNDTIYCTWLPDIFLYLLHKVAGLPGIFAFRYFCILMLMFSCLLYARKLRIASHPLVWLLSLLGVVMAYAAVYEKPEAFSFVLMMLLVWNWWHIRSDREIHWRSCYVFPLIMLIWVNSHGGFVFGVIFLFTVWLGEMVNAVMNPNQSLSQRLRGHVNIAMALSVLALFVTPYGVNYPLRLFFELLPTEANTSYNSKVCAYTSPFLFLDNYNIIIGANSIIFLLIILYWRNFSKIEWSSLLGNLVFAVLYTKFFRTTFYWVPVYLFSGLHLIAKVPLVPPGWKYKQEFSRMLPALIVVYSVWFAADSVYKSYTTPEKYVWMGFGISDGNPVEEARYIKKYFPNARLGNTYDQGAYLLWELWPKNKVFFDSRHFPYRAWSDEFFNFSSGNNIQEMLKKYPCDIWCVSLRNLPLITALLNNNQFKLAFYGKSAAVLVRSDLEIPTGSPTISNNFAFPKNLSCSIDALVFLYTVNKWETADKLYSTMVYVFKQKPHQRGMRWATLLHDGMTAYQSGNYQKAADFFERLPQPPTIANFLLTNSHLYLSENAWQQGNDAIAFAHARKAWDLVPGNPYSLYNLGAIVLFHGQNETLRQSNTDQKDNSPDEANNLNDWRWFLEEFLRIAPIAPEFDTYRPIAQAMLDGVRHQRPPLLIPYKPIR